jgi:hypothetical protein
MQRDAAFRSDVSEQLPRMPGIKSGRTRPIAASLRTVVRNVGWCRASLPAIVIESGALATAISPTRI